VYVLHALLGVMIFVRKSKVNRLVIKFIVDRGVSEFIRRDHDGPDAMRCEVVLCCVLIVDGSPLGVAIPTCTSIC